MKRGQKAAQNPSFGAWKLVGTTCMGEHIMAVYSRTVSSMVADGTWRIADEMRTRLIAKSSMAGEARAAALAMRNLHDLFLALAPEVPDED